MKSWRRRLDCYSRDGAALCALLWYECRVLAGSPGGRMTWSLRSGELAMWHREASKRYRGRNAQSFFPAVPTSSENFQVSKLAADARARSATYTPLDWISKAGPKAFARPNLSQVNRLVTLWSLPHITRSSVLSNLVIELVGRVEIEPTTN